jgi:hypothetical protein
MVKKKWMILIGLSTVFRGWWEGTRKEWHCESKMGARILWMRALV